MASRVPDRFQTARPAVAVAEIGRRVVEQEAEALRLLARTIDERFARAAALIAGTVGRVVVSGIGKSGHIGRKIAATLSATGTPSLFMHATEAAHGDLGMLLPGDVLLLLSRSGTTAELGPVCAHAETRGIPVVAICGNPDAPLFEAPGVLVLLLPPVREACPQNIAPTTSTTMTLALGDALALAAMELRGTPRATLAKLHPGGTIGARFRPVSMVMHGAERMPLVSRDLPMAQTIMVMTERSFGIAGVVDGAGTLAGVITDGDLRRHIAGLYDLTAADVMTHDPVTIGRTCTLEQALAIMNEHKITALFVTESDSPPHRPQGIIHIHDLIRVGVA